MFFSANLFVFYRKNVIISQVMDYNTEVIYLRYA